MKLTGISLSAVTLSSLIVVSTYCVNDPLLNRVYSPKTQAIIRHGLIIGTIGATADAVTNFAAPRIGQQANPNTGKATAAILLLLDKKNDDNLKENVIKFVTVVASFLAIDFLKTYCAKNASKTV